MLLRIGQDETFDLDDGLRPELRDGRLLIWRMSELHDVIDDALEVRRRDIAAGSEVLQTILYVPPPALKAALSRLSPQHAAYEAAQLQLYAAVAGRAYDRADEGHQTLDAGLGPSPRPMPFYMQPSEAGSWTVAYGHLLEQIAAPRGARVLEIGYGQGGLTELLVRAGLDVTALELHSSAASFLERRVHALGLRCHTVTGSVLDADLEGPYDRIIFYESFHHMPSFEATLRRLVRLLAPDGAVVFGAEPIVPDDAPEIPFPWGLRLDGGALSAARDVGWLEIGFQRSFFFNMLARLGLRAREASLPARAHSHVVIASFVGL